MCILQTISRLAGTARSFGDYRGISDTHTPHHSFRFHLTVSLRRVVGMATLTMTLLAASSYFSLASGLVAN